MTRNQNPGWIALLVVLFVAGATFAWPKVGSDNLPPGSPAATASSKPSASILRQDAWTHPGNSGERRRPGLEGRRAGTDGHGAVRGAVPSGPGATASAQDRHRYAKSLVSRREAVKNTATAVIAQRSAELDTVDRKLQRPERLIGPTPCPSRCSTASSIGESNRRVRWAIATFA